MKKVSLFLIGLLLGWAFCCCSTEEVTPDAALPVTATVGKVRSVGEALSELEAVLNHLDVPTRAGGQRTYSLDNVAVAGGSAATRGEEGAALPDTLAYVVNFDDGEGFAVLGALRNSAPVYALTERGTMDAARLNEAIAQTYARLTAPADGVPQTRAAEESEIREIGIDIVPQLLAQALVLEATTQASGDGEISDWGNPGVVLIDVTYSDWVQTKKYGPYVTTKWSQGYPFNTKCGSIKTANPDNWTFVENKGYNAVGCVMVALGQILACNKRPAYEADIMAGDTWEGFLSVSNYTNLGSYDYRAADAYFASNPAAKQHCNNLATFLAKLGSSDYCQAWYGASTGASPIRARNVMRMLDNVYYGKAEYRDMAVWKSSLYCMLMDGKPAYANGVSAENSHHAWVIDGYINRYREKSSWYRKNNGEVYDITLLEEGNLLHCNWGFLGYCDGYYEMNVFDMTPYTQREEGRDPDGPQNNFNMEREKNYSFETNVIIY